MKLVFLCPTVRKPVGGVKVIYHHAKLCQDWLSPHDNACVLHPNTWRHVDPWFDNGVPQMRARFGLRWAGKPSFSRLTGVFHHDQHRVVLTELWARKYARQLLEMGIEYAIYVQNGYFINKGEALDLDLAYRNARSILCVSEDTVRCVTTAFPHAKDRIQRVHLGVSAQGFDATGAKENVITYMPRKLSEHADKLLFFLRPYLPSHWRVEAIRGATPEQVKHQLARSKIFLSFSHFEGFGLPPLEAALSGNRVIGYTGEGGREYWHPAVFDEIHNGDILHMVEQVRRRISDWDQTDQRPGMVESLSRLTRTYSAEQERNDLQAFLRRMGFSLSG